MRWRIRSDLEIVTGPGIAPLAGNGSEMPGISRKMHKRGKLDLGVISEPVLVHLLFLSPVPGRRRFTPPFTCCLPSFACPQMNWLDVRHAIHRYMLCAAVYVFLAETILSFFLQVRSTTSLNQRYTYLFSDGRSKRARLIFRFSIF